MEKQIPRGYKVINNTQWQNFKDKVMYQPKAYLECIGHYHRMNQLNIEPMGRTCLSFEPASLVGSSFQLMIHWAKLEYNLDIERHNRGFETYHDLSIIDGSNINRKNVQLVGITVGDLLKYYYYNHKSNKNKEVVLDKNEQDTFEIDYHLKRATAYETGDICDVNNVLGLYNHTKSTINLWNSLKYIGHKNKDTYGLREFCSKMVYLSDTTINNLFRFKKSKGNSELIKFQFETLCDKLFNSLVNDHVTNKLLRYYLYNEEPNIDEGSDTIYYYEPPQFLTTILKEMHHKNKDNIYTNMYYLIMKKLNTREQKELEKYPLGVFNSIQSVPRSYPTYAYRNVILKQWSNRAGLYFFMGNDMQKLQRRIQNNHDAMTNQKHKYKLKITTKPEKLTQCYSHWRRSDKGKLKTKQIKLFYELNDFSLVDNDFNQLEN